MRSRYLVIGLCVAGVTAALAAPPSAPVAARTPERIVYLDNVEALERLRVTNPAHYARVERILASADQLCRAGKPKTLALKLDVRDFRCSRALLLTSYPPQRQLDFRLDDTRYLAMVFVTKPRGRLVPLREGAGPSARHDPPPAP